ncbi:MAG: hypothetical protein JEY71_05480 [Sphaerochaeta sp.]|nr:hypothetical protein [Sphaerochaeta sp.]
MRKALLLFVSLLLLCLPVLAQSWDRIETEHTLIIYEEIDAQYAQDIAAFADEVFLELAELLDHLPSRKVPVILSGRPAFSNGMFAPFPSSVILYLTSPVDRFLGSRTASWLRSLYTHELTHYLHLTSPVGPAKYLFFLGPEVPSMNTALMPLWWVEGITTYTESEYAQGGRGDSPLFALTWQSPMAEGSLWSLSQGRYNSSFPPSGRVYSTGFLMVDYLARHYGIESFARVNTAFTWFPFFGLNGALKKETGFSSKELFALAIEEQEKELPHFPSLGAQFSPDKFGDYYLPTTTDLGLVGYSYTQQRGGSLVRYATDTGVELLKDLPNIEGDSITFNPSQALFSFVWTDPFHASSLPLAPVSYSDLMLYDITSDSFRRITEQAMLYQPALSTDGKVLVAIERTGDRHVLVRINADTSERSVLYDNPLGSVFEPAILQDGTVVVVEIVGGNSSLLAVDLEGGYTVLVPPTRSEIRSPVHCDDGSLLFVSDDARYMGLYRYTFSSKKVEHLLSDPQGILKARIEGDDLLYETYRAKGIALKRVPLSSLSPTAVALQGPLAAEPSHPALEEIVYSSKSFVDYPRLNLVLPFPFVSENKLQPGLWFHSQSLLRRQLLIAQVGYDSTNTRLVGSMDYKYDPGPYAIGLQASFDKEQRATVTLSLPLLYEASLYKYKLLSLSTSLGFVTQDGDVLYSSLSAMLGHQVKGRSRPKDFFGAPYGSASLGMIQTLGPNSLKPDRYRLFAFFGGQLRMFSSSQMLGLQLDAVTDSEAKLDDALLYEGFSEKGLNSDAKARLSVRYHLPFGLLDQPIPYGGMTGLGLTLTAQSSLYLKDASVLWDEEVVVSGRLTASLVVGSGLDVRPFVALAYRVGDGKFSFAVGLNGSSLLVTKDVPML